MLRITGDSNLCTGHGRCYSVAPELIGHDDEGFSDVLDREVEVPAELEDDAHRAVANCPERALRIVDDAP